MHGRTACMFLEVDSQLSVPRDVGRYRAWVIMASKKKNKFYVVWIGKKPGVYETWAECESAIQGFAGAKYKSFPTLESADTALKDGPAEYWGTNKVVSSLTAADLERIGQPLTNSLCVDAAWNATSKVMEYQGVWNHDKSPAFHQGPFDAATNNIGEFLALVHALAVLVKREIDWPVYSDSQTAISWVRKKRVKSKSMKLGETSEQINNLVERALKWIASNTYTNQVLKWETEAWGEIPADFGRK